MPGSGLDRSYFTTEQLDDQQEKILAWQESCSFIFDYTPRLGTDPAPFEARIESYNFGSLITSVCASRGATWDRGPLDAARNGVDHYLVQFYTKGHGHFNGDTGEGRFNTGDLLILDATRLTHSVTTDFSNLTLWIPRPLLDNMVPDPDSLHGSIVPGGLPTTSLLRSHLLMVHEQAALMTPEQGEQLTRPTLDLLLGVMDSHPDAEDSIRQSRQTAATLAVKRYIRQHLDAPGLNAASIAKAVNMSRASLYRLCEPLGGVTHYIRHQRLHRVLVTLSKPELDHLPISQIASYWGFDEPSSFHRMFRREFGVNPGDARRHRLAFENKESILDECTPVGDRKYESWLTDLVT